MGEREFALSRWSRRIGHVGAVPIDTNNAASCRDPNPVLSTIRVGLSFPWSAALDTRTNRAFVSGFDSTNVPATNVLDLKSGVILRTLHIAGIVAADPAAGRMAIVNNTALYSINAATGVIVGTAALGGQPAAIAIDTRAHRAIVLRASGRQSTVVVATTTGAIVRSVRSVRIGAYTGTQSGQSNAPAPIIVDEATQRVFVTDDHAVYMFDTRTGALLRTIAAAHAALSLDGHTNHLFVLANNNGTGALTITVLDATTGVALRMGHLHIAQRLGDAFINAVVVDEATHRLFIAREGGYGVGDIITADSTSDQVISTNDAGYAPITMVLDAPLHRLFVAHQNLWNSTDNSPRSAGSISVQNASSGAVLRSVQVGWVPSQLLQNLGPQRLVVLNAYGNGIGSSSSSLSILSETALGGVAYKHSGTAAAHAQKVRNSTPAASSLSSSAMCRVQRPATSPIVRAHVALGARYPAAESFSIAIDALIHRAYIPSSAFGSHVGRVRIFDTCTGALVNTISVAPDARLVAVDVLHARVLVVHVPASGPGLVSILDARSGTVLHTIKIGDGPSDIAADALTGRAFVATQGSSPGHGTVSTIDVMSGRIIRTSAVGAFPIQVTVDTTHGVVLVPNMRSATISILDAITGRVRRTLPAAGPDPLAVAVDRPAGLAFIAGFAGIHVLHAPYGTPQRISIQPGSYDNLAVDEMHKTVLAGGHDDMIRLIRIATAYRVDTISIPPAHGATARTLAVDEQAGLAFVGTNGPANGTLTSATGYVTVLDTRSGHIRGAIPAGFRPTAAAVDSKTGLLFVLDSYYNELTILDDRHFGAAVTSPSTTSRVERRHSAQPTH